MISSWLSDNRLTVFALPLLGGLFGDLPITASTRVSRLLGRL
ncbi:hypothetical protein [Synechococcus sp. CBW1108]|nr:hypothetical protein [Synechococcus sp. CBW1108]